MLSYFLRRMLLIIPTFLGITLLVFTITRFVPGGPVERMLLQAQVSQNETGRSSGSRGRRRSPMSRSRSSRPFTASTSPC